MLRKRAAAKALTDAVVDGLVALRDTTPLRYSYRATAACVDRLHQSDGQVTGHYCGNRWCVVCNRIRTAKLLDAYLPEVRTWAQPMFVTLTVPNVPAERLHGMVRQVLRAVRPIAQSIRVTDRLPFRAIRKLEVTWNPRRRDYHPHLHLLVDGEATARALVDRWLRWFPDATRAAQDVRPCTRGVGSVVELFKYLTKLTVKVGNRHTAPPAPVLDTIFKAVRHLRTVQPMGFKVQGTPDAVLDSDGTVELDASTPALVARTEPTTWLWVSALHDWVDVETGECLSAYEPRAGFLQLLANIRADAFPPDDPPPAPG